MHLHIRLGTVMRKWLLSTTGSIDGRSYVFDSTGWAQLEAFVCFVIVWTTQIRKSAEIFRFDRELTGLLSCEFQKYSNAR